MHATSLHWNSLKDEATFSLLSKYLPIFTHSEAINHTGTKRYGHASKMEKNNHYKITNQDLNPWKPGTHGALTSTTNVKEDIENHLHITQPFSPGKPQLSLRPGKLRTSSCVSITQTPASLAGDGPSQSSDLLPTSDPGSKSWWCHCWDRNGQIMWCCTVQPLNSLTKGLLYSIKLKADTAALAGECPKQFPETYLGATMPPDSTRSLPARTKPHRFATNIHIFTGPLPSVPLFT